MSKKEFIKKFKALTQEDRNKVKQYHEEQLKNAIFIDTYKIAEKSLLWIQEAEQC